MLTHKNPRKPRPFVQKCKLDKLINCYQANPESSYKLIANRGVIHTAVDENRNFFAEVHGEDIKTTNLINCEEVDLQPKKKLGLFANIIRNMEAQKNCQEKAKPVICGEKNRGYTFYFTELDHKSKNQGNRKNTPDSIQDEEKHFNKIEIGKEIKLQCEDSNKENKAQQFIDLNFSFDQISKHIQSVKQNSQRRNEDTIIHKYLNENSEAEGENSKNDIKLSKGSRTFQKQSIERQLTNEKAKIQSINFAKMSKECKIPEPEHLPPISLKPKTSMTNVIKQSSLSALQGTKKVQSRIVSNNFDTNNINIDFDLDLNFI